MSPQRPRPRRGPPRTLFEIEREKRWRIWLLFALLLALAFVTAWVACLHRRRGLLRQLPRGGHRRLVSCAARVIAARPRRRRWACLAAVLVSRADRRARPPAARAMHCRPLDPGDRYHERLANIVEEMRLATGAPRIECVTVRTRGLQRLRLQRPARRRRHRRHRGRARAALAAAARRRWWRTSSRTSSRGSYVTVTVSCLLFGIYSSLGEELEEADGAGIDADAAPAALARCSLRGWLWVMQLASSVVSAALSRERERQADLAAVRYTRDPLSLAEALRIISRHPGGAGYIPEGLAPLCIRATGDAGLAGRLGGATRIRRSASASTRCWRSPTSRRASSSGRSTRPARTSSSASTGPRPRPPKAAPGAASTSCCRAHRGWPRRLPGRRRPPRRSGAGRELAGAAAGREPAGAAAARGRTEAARRATAAQWRAPCAAIPWSRPTTRASPSRSATAAAAGS